MIKPLTLNEGIELIQAVNKLIQLGAQKIIDKNSEAEKAGLETFVRSKMYEHASVLLACFYATKTEYEPLINSVSAIMNRAVGMNSVKQQAAEEAAK